jgi:hypothetical protein
MDKVTMTDLLNALDTKIDTITSVKEIQILTRKLRAPRLFPAVFLIPEESPEKFKDGDYVFSHIYSVSIIPIIFYATTEKESLVDSSKGLIKLMDDIEDLLENNFLDGKLVGVECRPAAYEIPEDWFIADNIYTRGGIISYRARTHSYRKERTP